MLQPNIDKLDCIVRVVTPENVEFEYMLAGPFQRALAFVFDFFVRIGAMFALLFLGMIGSIFVPFGSTLSTIAIILAYFVLSWFYGVYFESRFNGRNAGEDVVQVASDFNRWATDQWYPSCSAELAAIGGRVSFAIGRTGET